MLPLTKNPQTSDGQPGSSQIPLLIRLLKRVVSVFGLTVIVPTLLAGLYYGLIASDTYISESQFVVRSAGQSKPSGLASLLQGAGVGSGGAGASVSMLGSRDDAQAVHAYALSRDALRELDEKLKVRAAYSNPSIDIVSRFPGLDWDDSFEAFHTYYQSQVGISYDLLSSISVLRVRAFAAGDAQQMNESLLQMGERLVNTLNERSRRDLISKSEEYVKNSEERVQAAALAVASFRSNRAVFDPNSQSRIHLEAVARFQAELDANEAQLAEVRRVAPANPQVDALTLRTRGLRESIARESAKITGGNASLSAKSRDFDRLLLEKLFADNQLAMALSELESARREAQRKQVYLERLVQPSLPDHATEPRRVRSVFTVFVLGIVAWGVVSLILAGAREHVD